MAAALSVSSASAITIVEVFTEAEAAGGINNPFLDTVVVDGSTAYAVVRDLDGADDAGVVVAYDGTNFTTVSSVAQWQATGSTNDPAAGNGAAYVGGVVRFVSSLDNSVYEIDLGTGTATEVVSAATINAAIGSSASLVASFEVTSSGQIYAYDALSANRQIVSISPANAVSIEIPPADFATSFGTTVGGVGVLGDTILVGTNTFDAIVGWDTVNDVASTVVSTAQILAVTGAASAGFGDIFAAPDGLVYFYESTADSLLVFDPADVGGTLSVLVSEAQFLAGPSSDTINQLAWYNGSIAFTDTSEGFYSVVPEPASALAALLVVGGVSLRRRR
ncbi:PEP-CTERM sorting domain-containing protein [Botrimarina hoheduenensis]|uniref:PEP-CTERM sorting domain-containing protein n=1 Tax=Botrimarina hoheduenensis TaxID=2528000 RepID=UPI0018D48A90|nr:PEP-CTERM sorting domain-containing protein [Botrimarina hoheduenensis]